MILVAIAVVGAVSVFLALRLLGVGPKKWIGPEPEDIYLVGKDVVPQSNRRIAGQPTRDLSVIVPAYNETKRITSMINGVVQVFSEWIKDESITFEVIVVDDKSTDETIEVVKGLMQAHSFINLLQLGRNHGKGGAVKNGVLRAVGRYILMADADGATDFVEIRKLLKAIKSIEKPMGIANENVGMAIGSRAHMEKESVATRSLLRTILMHGFHFLVVICCSSKIRDTQCGFKLFTRHTARILFGSLHIEGWAFDTELILLAEILKTPMIEIPVRWREVDGSKLIETKLDIIRNPINMAIDMISVRYSYLSRKWKYPNY